MGPTEAIGTIRSMLFESNFTILSPAEGFDYSTTTETISFDTDKNALYNLTLQQVNASGGIAVSNAVIVSGSEGVFESKLIIPLYVVIFLLSVIGNSLVLITLVQNKRMRTVTNVYLLNLVSYTLELV
ncbi:hypothetical protein QE152_g37390 [Popillia japonica]|uniref:G-protein coupled receptors family 1 profile domain-containing protein n=1 Tax=Popillia japonica TaxID=7064 RepID=A0AAW1IAP3_POPJA